MLIFFSRTNFKLALKCALYDLVNARDVYREATSSAGIGMHHDVIQRYAEMQALIIAPIAPHWAEYVWLDILKKVSKFAFPFFHISLNFCTDIYVSSPTRFTINYSLKYRKQTLV